MRRDIRNLLLVAAVSAAPIVAGGCSTIPDDEFGAEFRQHPQQLLDAHHARPGLDLRDPRLRDADARAERGLAQAPGLAQGPQLLAELVREADGIVHARMDIASGCWLQASSQSC